MKRQETGRGGRSKSPSELPDTMAGGERPKVVSIDEWKSRGKRGEAATARLAFYRERIHLMTTQQKQAALVRVIISDSITPRELDSLLLTIAAPTQTSPGT
jgi:hypothetical protein